MPSLLDFIFNKRKPIPGEWEYDIHPYSQQQEYYAPLDTGKQGGLMDDWIPYEPTPYEPTEEPYEYPGVKFVTRGPYDEEAGRYTSETPLGEWEIPGTAPTTEPWYSTMAPRYIPHPSGEGSTRYTPEGFKDYLSSLTTEPEYGVSYDSYSAEPYLYATTPWGKGGGTPTDGFPPGMSPGDLATWDV